MKIEFDKIQTFGAGVTAYRIVTDEGMESSTQSDAATISIIRTDHAKRLGERLRKQFEQLPDSQYSG